MKTKSLFLSFLLFALISHAEVNMKNASFLSHWLDMAIDGPKGQLEVRRFYNSRSARVGLFGFGWCSAFEKSLKVEGDSAALSDCALESPQEVKQVERTPAGFGIRTDEDQMRFDKNGKLTHLKTKNGLDVDLIYQQGKLVQLKTKDGRTVNLKYDPRGRRVIEVRGSNGVKVKYEYSGDDLTAVITRGLQAKYTYDDLHNLIRIEHPDKRYEVIVYESVIDRVKKYRAPDGCIDSFVYKNADNNNYVSSAERMCGDRIVSRASYRFKHDLNRNLFQPVAREISSETKTGEN